MDSKNLSENIKLYFWGENAGYLLKGEQLFPTRITLQDKPQTIKELESLGIIHND